MSNKFAACVTLTFNSDGVVMLKDASSVPMSLRSLIEERVQRAIVDYFFDDY